MNDFYRVTNMETTLLYRFAKNNTKNICLERKNFVILYRPMLNK